MKCSTCKWWVLGKGDEHDVETLAGYDPETYDQITLSFEVRRCYSTLLRSTSDDPQPKAANEAVVMDASQYMAQLMTGSDFGCVNHESLT